MYGDSDKRSQWIKRVIDSDECRCYMANSRTRLLFWLRYGARHCQYLLIPVIIHYRYDTVHVFNLCGKVGIAAPYHINRPSIPGPTMHHTVSVVITVI